jgi:hypothetical protein
MYVMERIEPKTYFLNVLPMSNNETGEFASVIKNTTAAEDTANGTMGEPLDLTEQSEITEISLAPATVTLGHTSAIAYSFKYDQKFLNRSSSAAIVQAALSKVGAGMAHAINTILGKGIIAGASAPFPSGLSAWSTAIDPRIDARKMRTSMSVGTNPNVDLPFELDTAFVDQTRFDALSDYYTSLDLPFDATGINVDSTKFMNVKNAFNGLSQNFIGMDSSVPCGIVETYVDPNFSTIQQSILQNPQNAINLPPALINVNTFKEQKAPHNSVMEIWCEIGYNNREPLGAMTGNLN